MERAIDTPASDVIEAIIGYREWILIGDELVSPLARTTWDAGPVRAECLASCREARGLWRRPAAHPGPAPDPRCVCGIYALFEPPRRVGRERLTVARGAVALWGRVELHQRGMRAEYARVVTLALPSSRKDWDAATRTAERLGIEAVPAKHLREAALAHGRQLEPSLIPT
jgi:hypothetical protein